MSQWVLVQEGACPIGRLSKWLHDLTTMDSARSSRYSARPSGCSACPSGYMSQWVLVQDDACPSETCPSGYKILQRWMVLVQVGAALVKVDTVLV